MLYSKSVKIVDKPCAHAIKARNFVMFTASGYAHVKQKVIVWLSALFKNETGSESGHMQCYMRLPYFNCFVITLHMLKVYTKMYSVVSLAS